MPRSLYLSAPILVDRGYDYQTKDSHKELQMNIKTPFVMLLPLLFLAGCEQDRIKTLCDSSPSLCADLHVDSWCKFERSDLIRARRQYSISPDDASAYSLMVELDRYHDCLEPLLGIEYTKRKERKNDKLDAVIKAREDLRQLEQETRTSDYPYLQLWHWQRHGDHQARIGFLNQAGNPLMQQPELQKALAELLAPRDKQAAEQALHQALGLYPAGATIDTGIIANLINLYISGKRYSDAWVWARVLVSLDQQAGVNLNRMDAYARFDEQQQQDMQQQADHIVQRLKNGTYLQR